MLQFAITAHHLLNGLQHRDDEIYLQERCINKTLRNIKKKRDRTVRKPCSTKKSVKQRGRSAKSVTRLIITVLSDVSSHLLGQTTAAEKID